MKMVLQREVTIDHFVQFKVTGQGYAFDHDIWQTV